MIPTYQSTRSAWKMMLYRATLETLSLSGTLVVVPRGVHQSTEYNLTVGSAMKEPRQERVKRFVGYAEPTQLSGTLPRSVRMRGGLQPHPLGPPLVEVSPERKRSLPVKMAACLAVKASG